MNTRLVVVMSLMTLPALADTTLPVNTISDVVQHPDVTKLIDKRIKKKKESSLYRIGVSAGVSALVSVVCSAVTTRLMS